jgi:hypothetical protein
MKIKATSAIRITGSLIGIEQKISVLHPTNQTRRKSSCDPKSCDHSISQLLAHAFPIRNAIRLLARCVIPTRRRRYADLRKSDPRIAWCVRPCLWRRSTRRASGPLRSPFRMLQYPFDGWRSGRRSSSNAFDVRLCDHFVPKRDVSGKPGFVFFGARRPGIVSDLFEFFDDSRVCQHRRNIVI